MNTTAFNKHSYSENYPLSIDELNTPQWIHYLMLLAEYQNGQLGIEQFKEEWLSYLLGLDKVHVDKRDKEELLSEHQHLMDNYLVQDGITNQPATFSLSNKLSQYSWKGGIFRGPQDLGFDLSFGTFLKCSYVHRDYLHTQNPKALRYLFAILYSDGTPLPERIEKLSDMPFNVALSAFYFFQSVVNHLTTNPISFQGDELPLHQLFHPETAFGEDQSKEIEDYLFDLATAHCDTECSNLREKNLYEVLRFTWFKIKNNEA